MPDRDRIVEEKASRLIAQIGSRIAELRRQAGWSQNEFAEILNRSVQWVSLVETGRQNLTVHTMVRVAHKLGVDVPELLRAPSPEGRRLKRGRGRPRKTE